MNSVLLSVVVPVYAVEGYLYQCLDSIRAGLTPRRTRRSRSSRWTTPRRTGAGRCWTRTRPPGDLSVVHLSRERRAGPGPQRRAGRGDRRVRVVRRQRRLAAAGLGAARCWPRCDATGRTCCSSTTCACTRTAGCEADASSPPAGRPAGRERMLGVQHTAWNRIVKRDFLPRSGLTLPARLVRGRPVQPPGAARRRHGSPCSTGSATTTGSAGPARSPRPAATATSRPSTSTSACSRGWPPGISSRRCDTGCSP